MTNKSKTELVVSAIENGTVIDHIPASKVLQLINILGLESYEMGLVGLNLYSKKNAKG